MLKLFRLGMVSHSKLSYLAALLPNETPVCSLMMLLSGGPAWNHGERSIKRQAEGTYQPLEPTAVEPPVH